MSGAGPAEPLPPLAAPAAFDLSFEVDCALLVGPPTAITVRVTEAPAWLAAQVAPADLPIDVTRCDGAVARTNATLLLQATGDAPAFTPVTVQATLPHATGERSAEASFAVRAAYFSVIDASAIATSFAGAPGERLTLPLTLSNLGNADTRIIVSVQDSGGLAVQPPLPIVLPPRGSQTVDVVVALPSGGGLVNAVTAVTLNVTSAYALDGSQSGDGAAVSYLVSTRGFDAPAAAALAAGAIAVAAAKRRS